MPARTVRRNVRTIASVGRAAKKLKQKGKTIVTTNGIFDILHVGHIRGLKEAKSLGDILIVGINSDTSVRELKGPFRPVQTEERRAEMLLALRYVDFVFIFNERDPTSALEHIRPDIHAKSIEYKGRLPEQETVERCGGKIHWLNHLDGISTTELCRRICDAERLTARYAP